MKMCEKKASEGEGRSTWIVACLISGDNIVLTQAAVGPADGEVLVVSDEWIDEQMVRKYGK